MLIVISHYFECFIGVFIIRIRETMLRIKDVKMPTCRKGSSWVVKILEDGFYQWGIIVANRPWLVIALSILLTCLCSIGLINFTSETDPNKLWIPNGSSYLKNKQWLSENFPQDKRVQTIIFQSQSYENILSPQSLKEMMALHKKISMLRPNNVSFEDICQR